MPPKKQQRTSSRNPSGSHGAGKARSKPTDNKAQAAARLERRNGSGSGAPKSYLDVYEYAAAQDDAGGSGSSRDRAAAKTARKLKRAITDTAALEDRDTRRVGSDEDDEEEHDSANAPAFLDVGEGEVDTQIQGDDEELDSDEAWGESDEEKWGDQLGKKSGNKGAGKSRTADSDEEEEEDDEDDEMLDLSRMLEASDDDDEQDDDDDDEESAESGDDSKLEQHMASLASAPSKRRAVEEGVSAPASKRRVLEARSEAVPESEFAVSGGGKLRVEDLISSLGETGASFSSLRQSARSLAAAKAADRASVASKRGGGALHAPLPAIVQDRLDRAAAYDASKAEVQGWAPTIKRIREAEHLSFPLQPEVTPKASTAAMTATFKPENALERNIAALLAGEGMSDKLVQQGEELEMNRRGMDADEIKRRREELRRMRDLLFREEQKAKRVKKIKSKAYRKVARKEREKEERKAAEAGLTLGYDDDDDVEDADKERHKAERDRARERATLKHKNTSKWAKGTLGNHHALQENTQARMAIEEQLQRSEQLRRRIHGQASDEEEDDDDESDDSEAALRDPRKDAFDELAKLEAEQDEEVDPTTGEKRTSGKKGGVWAMKFMQDARLKDARATQEDIDDFRQELEQMGSDAEEEVDSDVAQQRELQDRVKRVEGNAGRAVYGTTGKVAATTASAREKKKRVPREGDEEESSDEEQQVQAAPADIAAKPVLVSDPRPAPAAASTSASATATSVNPWLAGSASKSSRQHNSVASVSKESSAVSRSAHRMARNRAKGDEARAVAEDDARLDINPDARLAVRTEQRKSKAAAASDSDSDDSDGSVDEPVAVGTRGLAAIKQRSLVAEAFAGDDVAAEFAAEKAAIAEADAPKEVDETLPGWGTWGGKGVRQSGATRRRDAARRKLNTRTIAGLAVEQRKDAKLENVIVNERRDKKVEKYKPKDVPYPYTSVAQYEMAMRNPVGPEWNTRTQHQRLTLPRVVTKPGKIIAPLERKF